METTQCVQAPAGLWIPYLNILIPEDQPAFHPVSSQYFINMILWILWENMLITLLKAM